MNRQRERRLLRVKRVFQDRFDKCVGEVVEARARQAQAQRELESIRHTIEVATEQRLVRLQRGTNADEWFEQHAWDDTLKRKEELAVENCQVADTAVAHALQRLMKARSDVDRMGAILKRIETSRKADEARAERKDDDEAAALRSRPESDSRHRIGSRPTSR